MTNQPLPTGEITLVGQGSAARIYIDPKGQDYSGLCRVARSFAEDVKLVTGVAPAVTTEADRLEETVLIFGSIGNNDLLDSLIKKGAIDVSSIRGKRECYTIQVIEQPVAGVDKALVVAGSDKRGAIYGIYSISEQIGVSPWVYWADVVPEKKQTLQLPVNQLNTTSKEPSVKYRGVFLNDDWPSLGSWVTHSFGDFNEEFYDKVFELILRLKGNYLWPAMWSAEFSLNGKSSPIANVKHADEYGIVMGTSHHEPLFRAGSEWQKVYAQYGSSNLWDFRKNREAITAFWEDGIKRNKDFESIITLGMRGESDSELEGSDEENIELLKEIIRTQKDLLQKYNLGHAPQILAVYKEVEKFWYGTDKLKGLKDWEVLEDVTILLADDNFGNLRKIPAGREQSRRKGWGMYYHFDYHGGPYSYEWVNTVPLEKVWEQMSMAYDYGIRDIWIVNVGDLKPMELPMSYFLDLAYDFEAWGTQGINRTGEYTKRWVEQQFGADLAIEARDGIAQILTDYTRMNGRRKPEIIYPSTFSPIHYNEAQRVLRQAVELENAANQYRAWIPESHKDTYDGLVYFPAAASANVVKMQIYAGLSALYYSRNSVLASTYAELTKAAIERDKQLEHVYNNEIAQGKWKGMMSSLHVGYVIWNSDGSGYPDVSTIIPQEGSRMIVDVEGTEQGFVSGTATLPVFTNLQQESYNLTISNGGDTAFDYQVETTADWVTLESRQGRIDEGKTIQVTVDWDKVTKTSMGTLIISGADGVVEVNVVAEWIDTEGLPPMTFIESHDVVAIEAQHAFNFVPKSGAEWKVIENYGRSLSSIKMFPTGHSFEQVQDAPYLEYRIRVNQSGDYILTIYTAPTNNLSPVSSLRYAVAFDGQTPVYADVLPADFEGGNYNDKTWSDAVMNNIHTHTTLYSLAKGVHVLRFYGLDAGLVLQKLVLSMAPLPCSFLGPEESYYTC